MITILNHRKRKVAKKILTLQKEAYQVEATYLGVSDIPPLRDTTRAIMYSNEEFIGFWDGKSLIGSIAYEVSKGALILSRVMVSPSHFRKGIATALLQYLFSSKGEDSVYIVTTGAQNYPAIELYKKFGFTECQSYATREGIQLLKLIRTVNEDAFPKA